MKNKGQMFLITAVIVIVTLITLVTTSNLTNIIQEKRELEGRFEREFFINTANELVKTIEISYHQSSNITKNVFDFGNFTRKKMTEKLQDFDFLYVGLITSNSSEMNVTVVNLLNEKINVTLSLNSSTSQNASKNNISDSGSWDTVFNISSGNDYILTVNYTLTSPDIVVENITIVANHGKDVYVGFFDIRLIGSETKYKDKFQKTYTLSVSSSTTTTVATTTTTGVSSTTTTIGWCSGTNACVACDYPSYQFWDVCRASTPGDPTCNPVICCDWRTGPPARCVRRPCGEFTTQSRCEQCTGCSWN